MFEVKELCFIYAYLQENKDPFIKYNSWNVLFWYPMNEMKSLENKIGTTRKILTSHSDHILIHFKVFLVVF